jgi:probable HAF family extracellular repeat protein
MLKSTAIATGIGLIALVMGEVTIPQQATAASLYSITDLGSLNPTATGFDAYSAAYGINNIGQVVGNSVVPSTDVFRSHAFRTAPNSVINRENDLGTLGGNSSTGYAINDSGQVVGESKKTVFGTDYAFLWSDATGMQDLGTLGGDSSVASAINNLGQVVGSAQTTAGEFHPFFYSGSGRLQDLTTLAGLSNASDINDSGQIVGSAQNRPALYSRSGGLQNLGTFGGEEGIATAINNLGQVVGWADTGETYAGDPRECPCNITRAFLYDGSGTLQDLGTLGGPISRAIDINNLGQIVGDASNVEGSNVTVPFVYSDGRMRNLNDLIPANSSWYLSSVEGINNAGQIVGTGTIQDPERNYPVHAFLLNPIAASTTNTNTNTNTTVPEPSSGLGFVAFNILMICSAIFSRKRSN